jgi:hypothetical protein
MEMKNKPAGGPGSRVVKKVSAPKAEPKSRAINPRGVSQIDSSMGNHITDKGAPVRGAVENINAGRGYMPVGPTDNVKAVGVGGGRTVYGCGTQAQTGPVAGTPKPQGRDILNNE